jgi:Neprosin
VASESQSGGGAQFPGIVPLDAHLDMVADTSFAHVRLDPSSRVQHEADFNAMKSHIADLYSGVESLHSFEDLGGTVFDCIPVEQQPSLRGQAEPAAEPPDLTAVLRGGEPTVRPFTQPVQPDSVQRDRHGNAAWAPAGTIPFPRVTLTELSRFESLDAFFRKHPGIAATATAPGVLIEPSPEATPAEHRYARVDQQAPNIGGHSAFTLYSPTVGSNQVFSLSQQWYYGGSGKELQTVEIGWQVFPTMYSHSVPVLFIYWTASAYEDGTGNYNLTKAGFVATKNGKPVIGSALSR